MKKVIAILAVMLIVAGTVFAAATIKVQSKVKSDDPVFILKAGLTETAFNTAESDDNNIIGWKTIDKSIKDQDLEVFFQILQSGKAGKDGQKFTLEVSASTMKQVKTEDGGELPDNTTPHETTQGSISEEDPKEATNVVVKKDGDAKFKATYAGTVADGTPLASFKVVWAKDSNAVAGIYEASVHLEVTPE